MIRIASRTFLLTKFAAGAKNSFSKKVSQKSGIFIFLEQIAVSVLLTTIFYHGFFPQYAFASFSSQGMEFPYDEKLAEEYRAFLRAHEELRQLKERARASFHVVTAYSSTIRETDNNPFVTASGTHVREGIVAANTLPFGSKILIPAIFGDKVFTVEDRMASKNHHKIDVWFPSTHEARQFGVKKLKILILPPEAATDLKHLEA